MASISLGSVVADIRGSIGTTVYSRNLGGAYTKARVTPTNPKSPAQQTVRASWKTCSQAWGQVLSEQQRQQWDVYASTQTVTNRIGVVKNPTGFQSFIKINQVFVMMGYGINQTPPSSTEIDPGPELLGLDLNTNSGFILLLSSPQLYYNNWGVIVSATALISPSRKPTRSAYRWIGLFTAQPGFSHWDFISQYASVFGWPGNGMKMGVSCTVVNISTYVQTPGPTFYGITY